MSLANNYLTTLPKEMSSLVALDSSQVTVGGNYLDCNDQWEKVKEECDAQKRLWFISHPNY